MDRAPDETIEGRILCIVNVITLGGRPRVGRNAEPLGSCPTSCGRNHHAKCVQLTWSRCPEPACLGSMHWYSEEVLVGVSERMRSMLFDERHQRSHIKQRLCFDPIQISSGPKSLTTRLYRGSLGDTGFRRAGKVHTYIILCTRSAPSLVTPKSGRLKLIDGAC